MPSYWADPGNFEALLKEIDRNLLFEDDIRSICAKMNKVTTCPESGCQNCNHHPFSALYKLGMLGYVVPSENRNDYATQEFLSSDRITYFHEEDNLQINGQTLYLIHPALTKSIEKLKSGKKIKHFTGFIIGKGIEVKQSTLQQILKSHKESTKEDFVHFWYKNI